MWTSGHFGRAHLERKMALRERFQADFGAARNGRSPQESAGTLVGAREDEKMTNCRGSWSLILVEVAGIEPASRTPPDCRNYNHEHSMGPDRLYFKACGKKHVAASLVGSAIISFYSKAPTRIARLTWRSIFRCSPSAVMPCASSCLTMASIPVRSIW